jgi:hypothetical protein
MDITDDALDAVVRSVLLEHPGIRTIDVHYTVCKLLGRYDIHVAGSLRRLVKSQRAMFSDGGWQIVGN